ncbi:MAG TPA: phasin family protein [Thermoanaerobaculia bacterium]|nr:phasin family protein [Thermoanaerobaculia bacterium]
MSHDKHKKERKAQRDLKESAQKIWLAGLGALAVAEEEGVRMFDSLVERGRDWEDRGKERVDEARSRVEHAVDDVEERIDERVSKVMHRLGVPTRDEIHRLTRKVEELNAKIERLHTPPPAPAPPRAGAGAKGATAKGASKPKAPPKPKGTGKAGGTA